MDSVMPFLTTASAILSFTVGCAQSPKTQAAAPAPSVASSAQPALAPPAPVQTGPAQPGSAPDGADAAVAVQKPPPAATLTLEERYNQAEQQAVAAIAIGDLAAAERGLRELLIAAEAEGDFTGLFLHYELAWLRWAAHDTKASLDEIGAAEAYMARSQLFGNSSVYQRLNILWLRAFFSLEYASETPMALRASNKARAQAARKEHAAGAGNVGQQAQADLLAALFAVRSGNRALATKRSASFHLIEEPDPTELFVMVQIYTGIGNAAEADAARKKIKQAEPSVLRSLVLSRLQQT
jgi:hypothetical protein